MHKDSSASSSPRPATGLRAIFALHDLTSARPWAAWLVVENVLRDFPCRSLRIALGGEF